MQERVAGIGGTTVALANSNVVEAIKGTSTVYANGKVVAQPQKLVYAVPHMYSCIHKC